MRFVANSYNERGFIRLHYSNCQHIPWNIGREPWLRERWFEFETIAETVLWQETTFPNHFFRPCETCQPHTVLQQEE